MAFDAFTFGAGPYGAGPYGGGVREISGISMIAFSAAGALAFTWRLTHACGPGEWTPAPFPLSDVLVPETVP